ncbi:MAG: hypothetical protein MRERV_74c008 [Mycoplasmataceae bacterium RV_VA103A]|nr:MAG: hypothetical protein MRERV_74c008 [Mycoplasmataceae bacterium RV_VA103A]
MKNATYLPSSLLVALNIQQKDYLFLLTNQSV